jgi:predicted transcriptional regulator of viral defense system
MDRLALECGFEPDDEPLCQVLVALGFHPHLSEAEAAIDAYGDLLKMNRPIVTNREAAARWRASHGTAARRLRRLEEAGLVRRLRRGLWALDPNIEPFVVVPYLTAPLPAYVSFFSALSRHEMIEQIPRQTSVASLDRAQRITTTIGIYEIHHLAPELFTGYEGSEETGYLATPEKALFDSVYVRAASGGQAFFPELSLPGDFDDAKLRGWIARIVSSRLRTLVSRRLNEVLPAGFSTEEQVGRK